MVHTLSQSPGGTVTISDVQFSKLVAMLKPGFELSTLMLADYKRANPPPVVSVPDVVAPSASKPRTPAPDVVVRREMTNEHEIGSAPPVSPPPAPTSTGFEAR